jgi:formate dehydrogenase gamma subunit
MKRWVSAAFIVLIASLWLALPSPKAAIVRLQNEDKSATQAMTTSDCLACHGDPQLAKEVDGKIVSLFIDQSHFANSIHGSLDCTSCHSDIKVVPHDPAPAKVDCSQCHSEAQQVYNESLHAKAIQNGNSKAASCLDCHGSAHEIVPSTDPKSKTNHTNIAATCGNCHGQKFVMEGSGLTSRPFLSYKESVHGKAVQAGNEKAAVCTDCHGSHDIRPPTDVRSSIFKFNVPKTCGQCHSNIEAEFTKSIHGQAIARGNSQAPVCTDCHGIHAIKSHIDPNSSVAAQALAKTTCARCHEGVKLTEEFGVAGKRVSSYLDSYHGLASKLGSGTVANCASCHGVHNILPSSDPNSKINAAHLAETCGKCHPGASENFILGKVHLDAPSAGDVGSVATRWVRTIYLGLIFVVIGAMLFHNGLVWRKKAIARKRSIPRTIVRMTLNQRTQHWLLLSSFFALVLTGFALAYPDSWLAMLLGSSESFRRIAHRSAGVVMIGSAFYHAFYMLFTREGRQNLREFMPRLRDVKDLVQNLRFYLGGKVSRPMFGKFGYTEKAEYWAVIWGTLIMGLTGLMIWFKVEWFGFLPRWVIDVATSIHFYEAVLATLAIIVWHFYHVIFDPDVYPLNWAVLDGKVSEEFYKHEHGLDFSQLEEENSKDRSLSELQRRSPSEGGDLPEQAIIEPRKG